MAIRIGCGNLLLAFVRECSKFALRALVQALAEQSFMTHILIKRLEQLGLLQQDEMRSLFEYSEGKKRYIEDFKRDMKARGLHFN